MKFLSDSIIPFIGTETFKLGDTLQDVRTYLKSNKIRFNQSVNPNKGCTPEVAWTFIEIEKSITLCFVKDILFEILFENEYKGTLPNGCSIGTKMSELEKMDPTLDYNDADEDFISENGYWIGDEIETGLICSITVFLPEVDRDDFFKYEWLEKYLNKE